MIKAGIFDVGGVLHRDSLFAPGDFTLDHFDFSEADFYENFVHKDVVALARKLKDINLKLAIISNTVEAHALYLTQMGLYDEFDELILSYRVHVRKPDPKIFQIALQRLDVKPDETFYVDDLQENVDGANTLGIHGILFTSYNSFKGELLQLGLKI